MKRRLVSGFGLLVLVFGVVAGGAVVLHRENRSLLADAERHDTTAHLMAEARFDATLATLLLERYVNSGVPPLISVIGASIAMAQDSVEHARALERTQEDEDGLVKIAGLTETAVDLEALAVTAGVVVGLRESGDVAGARAALEAASRQISQFGQRLNIAVEGEEEEAVLLEARAERTGEVAFWLLVGSGVGAAFLALLASDLVARSILKPLAALEKNAIRVAEGDLESRAETVGLDELASLGGSFNRMADSLIGSLRRQEQVNDQLRESEEWLQLAQVAGVGIGIFDLDVPGNAMRCSDQYYRLFGLEPRATAGTVEECFARIHPEDRKRVQEEVAGSLRDGAPYDTEFRTLWPDGSLHWLTSKASVFFAENGEPQRMIGTVLDVSKQKRAEEEIRHLAYHDALTGLPNRSLLMDRLEVALAQAKRQRQMVAVMFLDLDRFKVVNDTAGHLEGDALLRMVGAELTALVREGDTVARIGGDEFVLLLPAVERSGSALEIAQRILESFREPRLMGGHEFHITVSIGVATFPAAGDSAEALLTNADIAMYHAKQEGRDNCKAFTQELGATIIQRLALETDLRHGIDRGEFLVHYQPQVDAATGRITGTEALVRWQHPQRGLLMPQEFLTIAEETGLILPLGDWVLRAACAQTRVWQAATNLPLTVSVNLSARQFQQRDLAERVRHILLQTGLDAASLQLEITESIVIHDVDYTIALLHNLKEMGVRIAIDDFGTGHSALSYLRRLPIDVVKIDQSFIHDLAGNAKDPELVMTIIRMTHALKLGVIAEGVETEAQAGLLRLMLCDELQGALFSMPLPPDELIRLIRDPANARVA